MQNEFFFAFESEVFSRIIGRVFSMLVCIYYRNVQVTIVRKYSHCGSSFQVDDIGVGQTMNYINRRKNCPEELQFATSKCALR